MRSANAGTPASPSKSTPGVIITLSVPGGEAMARAGLTPITLEAKEGLALVNGTEPFDPIL